MKYILIIVLSILTFSQSKKDSLLNLAKNSNSDSVRITAYKDLADLSFGDPNLVPEYLNKALEIAKNNSFYEKIALLYNEKAVQKISISEFDSAEYYYRRSLEFSVDHKLGTTGFKTYQGLSAVARKRNDPLLEKGLLFKAGEFAKNNNYLTGVGESYRFLASFYARNGNSDSARFYLDKGVDFFNTNNYLEMDICLVKIPRERDKVLFSGAKRPLFVTRPNGDIESIRGDLKSIGGRQRKKDVDFTTKEIPIEKDMGIYLLSDGFIDQIGVDGKKFETKNFKNFLSKNYKYTMNEQERLLDFEFKNHIGKQEQRDVIKVIGIKL